MPDFEAFEAPEWITVRKKQSAPVQQHSILLVPDFEPDNEARAAWRRGAADQHPAPRSEPKIVPRWHDLPADFDPQAQVPDESRAKGKWSLTPLIPELEEIGIKTDSHLVYKAKGYKRPAGVEIWSKPEQVKEIRRLLNEWVRSLDPAFARPKRSRWAKIYSLSPMSKAEKAKQLHEDEIKQGFRRDPEPDYNPESVGYFSWPSDVVKASDVLGRSFEVLDPIRMDHRCYIRWNPEHSIFQIMGKNREGVEKATLKVRATFFQVIARQSDPKPKYLVCALSEPTLTQQPTISLEQFDSGSVDLNASMIPRLKLGKPSLMPAEGGQGFDVLRLQRSIAMALERLPYYSGNISMRARLGQFILTRYRPETDYSLQDFEQLLRDWSLRGLVTKDNGDRMKWRRQKKLAKTLNQSPEVLQPLLDHVHDDAARGKTFSKRRVNAIFVVAMSNEPGYFKIEVLFDRPPGGELQRRATRVSRVDREDGEFTKVSDTCMINLERGSSAWSFDINAAYPVDATRHPQLFEWIEDNIRVGNAEYVAPENHKSEFLPQHRFVSYEPMTAIKVISIQQQSVQMYAIPNTNLRCEVSINEMFVNRTGSRIGAIMPPFEPAHRWISLSVFDPMWDVKLAENAAIRVGERVKWNGSLDDFFPSADGSKHPRGQLSEKFQEFVSVLDAIQAIAYPSRLDLEG